MVSMSKPTEQSNGSSAKVEVVERKLQNHCHIRLEFGYVDLHKNVENFFFSFCGLNFCYVAKGFKFHGRSLYYTHDINDRFFLGSFGNFRNFDSHPENKQI